MISSREVLEIYGWASQQYTNHFDTIQMQFEDGCFEKVHQPKAVFLKSHNGKRYHVEINKSHFLIRAV